MGHPDITGAHPLPGSLVASSKSQSTFLLKPTDSHSRLALEHTETANTLSGATLASRHQSVSDGDNGGPQSKRNLAGSPELDCCWPDAESPQHAKLNPILEARSGPHAATGLRSKLFQTLNNQTELFLADDNFADETDVDVLCVSGADGPEL